MEYPLYQELEKKSSDSSEKENLEDLRFKLNSLEDLKTIEIIWSLIIHHSIINGDFKEDRIPYNPSSHDKGLSNQYQIKDLPKKLLRILWIYLY